MVGICTVLCPRNIRVFSDINTDLDISAGHPQVVTERQLRSLGIRAGLFDGRLRVLEGHIEFALKDSTISIDGVAPDGNIMVTIIGPDQSIWQKSFITNNTVKIKDGIISTEAQPKKELVVPVEKIKEDEKGKKPGIASKIKKLLTKKKKG